MLINIPIQNFDDDFLTKIEKAISVALKTPPLINEESDITKITDKEILSVKDLYITAAKKYSKNNITKTQLFFYILVIYLAPMVFGLITGDMRVIFVSIGLFLIFQALRYIYKEYVIKLVFKINIKKILKNYSKNKKEINEAMKQLDLLTSLEILEKCTKEIYGSPKKEEKQEEVQEITKCPLCDQEAKKVILEKTLTRNGKSLEYKQPAIHCDSCNESFMSHEDLQQTRSERVTFLESTK